MENLINIARASVFCSLLLVVAAQEDYRLLDDDNIQTSDICQVNNPVICSTGYAHVLDAKRVNCESKKGVCCNKRRCGRRFQPATEFFSQVMAGSNIKYNNAELKKKCGRNDCSCSTTVKATYKCVPPSMVLSLTSSRRNSNAIQLDITGEEAYIHIDGTLGDHKHCTIHSTTPVQLNLLRTKLSAGNAISVHGDSVDWVYNHTQEFIDGVGSQPYSISVPVTSTLDFEGPWSSEKLFLHLTVAEGDNLRLNCSTKKPPTTTTKTTTTSTAASTTSPNTHVPDNTTHPAADGDTSQVNVGGIVGGTLTVLIVLTLAAIGLVMYRRQMCFFKKLKNKGGKPTDVPEVPIRRVGNATYDTLCDNTYTDIDEPFGRKRSTKYEDIVPSSPPAQQPDKPFAITKQLEVNENAENQSREEGRYDPFPLLAKPSAPPLSTNEPQQATAPPKQIPRLPTRSPPDVTGKSSSPPAKSFPPMKPPPKSPVKPVIKPSATEPERKPKLQSYEPLRHDDDQMYQPLDVEYQDVEYQQVDEGDQHVDYEPTSPVYELTDALSPAYELTNTLSPVDKTQSTPNGQGTKQADKFEVVPNNFYDQSTSGEQRTKQADELEVVPNNLYHTSQADELEVERNDMYHGC